MPGAVVMTVTIFCYGIGWWDVLLLGLGVAAHFVIVWVYVLWSPLRVPRLGSVPSVKQNPFRKP
jgi:cell division protein FtsW (lipid II flippase)